MLKTPHVRWACIHKYIKFAYAIKIAHTVSSVALIRKKLTELFTSLLNVVFLLLLLLLLFAFIYWKLHMYTYMYMFSSNIIARLLKYIYIYTLCMVYICILKAFSSISKRLFWLLFLVLQWLRIRLINAHAPVAPHF